MNLRELLRMQPVNHLTEFEVMAKNMVRQLSLMGYGAYEVWEITTQMEAYALEAQEHPDLFPQNQRPLKLKAFRVR